jgi:hypothetical protein
MKGGCTGVGIPSPDGIVTADEGAWIGILGTVRLTGKLFASQ